MHWCNWNYLLICIILFCSSSVHPEYSSRYVGHGKIDNDFVIRWHLRLQFVIIFFLAILTYMYVKKTQWYIYNLYFSANPGINSAKRLKEFILTKTVCDLIDFEFEPTLLSLGGPGFPNLSKIVLQGNYFNWQF